jgi:sensor histidine kinase YesM
LKKEEHMLLLFLYPILSLYIDLSGQVHTITDKESIMENRIRRKKFVLHGLQKTLIITIMGIIIAISASLIVLSLLLYHYNSTGFIAPENQMLPLIASIWPIVITAVVLYGVCLWALIIITHRIYGPLYRLTVYIKKLVNGDITDEIVFRKDDAITGLKEIYNDLRTSLEKTLHYNYTEMVHIFSELEDILDKIYNKKIKDRELYNSLQECCSKLARALDMTSEAIEKKE